MAIAGVETQGFTQISNLRPTQQQNRTDDLRAQEAQESTFDAAQSDAETRAVNAAAETTPAPQGSGVPGTTLDSQSLSALLQATQEQDTETLQSAASDEERQEEASAPNSTNSLLPGASDQGGGNADPRGVSFLV